MKQKTPLIVGAAALVILLLVLSVSMSKKQSAKKQITTSSSSSLATLDDTEKYAPLDKNVAVTLSKATNPNTATLTIKGVPEGTTTFDYEFSYDTKAQGTQGVVGYGLDAIKEVVGGSFNRDILLGTCSTGGKCVYHEVVGPISVVVVFSGPYGKQKFEGSFTL